MVASAGNDDLIICRHAKEAERVRRLVKGAGKLTKVTAVEHAEDIHSRVQRVRGRVHFDHDWVHQFFVDAVKSAEDDLRRLAESFSSVPADRTAEQYNVMNRQRRGDFPV